MDYEERWMRRRIKELEKGISPVYPNELENTKHALTLLEEANEQALKRKRSVDFDPAITEDSTITTKEN